MPNEIKTIYKVVAWDVVANKPVEFNIMLTKTYEDALKFAKHLHTDVKDYFKDVKLITETYELKKRETLEFKEVK